MGKKRLVEWETIVHIVRREVEPLEYSGDIDGAKNVLEKLPQEDGLVLKKWGDVLFKEAQMNMDFEAAKKALTKAQLAEEAFPQAKYKHTAKQLQDSIKKWIEQNSIPLKHPLHNNSASESHSCRPYDLKRHTLNNCYTS